MDKATIDVMTTVIRMLESEARRLIGSTWTTVNFGDEYVPVDAFVAAVKGLRTLVEEEAAAADRLEGGEAADEDRKAIRDMLYALEDAARTAVANHRQDVRFYATDLNYVAVPHKTVAVAARVIKALLDVPPSPPKVSSDFLDRLREVKERLLHHDMDFERSSVVQHAVDIFCGVAVRDETKPAEPTLEECVAVERAADSSTTGLVASTKRAWAALERSLDLLTMVHEAPAKPAGPKLSELEEYLAAVNRARHRGYSDWDFRIYTGNHVHSLNRDELIGLGRLLIERERAARL